MDRYYAIMRMDFFIIRIKGNKTHQRNGIIGERKKLKKRKNRYVSTEVKYILHNTTVNWDSNKEGGGGGGKTKENTWREKGKRK